MTFSTIPCRIEKRAETQPLRTRSSGDRAFGSGPKGRRFESCRVQRRSLEQTERREAVLRQEEIRNEA